MTSFDLAYQKALDEAAAILQRRPGKRLSEAVRDYAVASEIAAMLTGRGFKATSPRGRMPTAFSTGPKGRAISYHSPLITVDLPVPFSTGRDGRITSYQGPIRVGHIGVYSRNKILRTSGAVYDDRRFRDMLEKIVGPEWHVV